MATVRSSGVHGGGAGGRAPSRSGEAARRMLNLLFTLHVAVEPLTTDQIIDDPEIGYASPGRDSRIKAFNRDRSTLGELGVVIREAPATGTSKNEQRKWEIDREATHAEAQALEPYDAEDAVGAIDRMFSLHAADPARWPLQRARTKLCVLAGIDPHSTKPTMQATSRDLGHLWDAFMRRRAASFTYRKANGEERGHVVDLYGILEQGTHTYLVGRDHEAAALRTFRTDRITSAKRAPESGKPYQIPSEFDVAGYRFLPFDFSANAPIQAHLSFAKGVGTHEIELVTKGRGTVRRQTDGSSLWSVDVRDLDAAARFALEHAGMGMQVAGPPELARIVSTLKRQAVAAHVPNS